MKTLGDSGNNKPGQPKIGTFSFSTLPEYDPKAPCGLWILKFEKASDVLLAFVNYIQYQNDGIYTQQQNDQIACIGNMMK